MPKTKKKTVTPASLELRLYGLVPYNISPIQQAIQYGHAAVEFMLEHGSKPIAKRWARRDKTFIILNGGTTNLNPLRPGSLNSHLQILKEQGVMVSQFQEPDLGDQLTAVVFLVDARVFDRKKFPDFDFSIEKLRDRKTDILDVIMQGKEPMFETAKSKLKWRAWVKKIGGEKNLFLRFYLKNLKLA